MPIDLQSIGQPVETPVEVSCVAAVRHTDCRRPYVPAICVGTLFVLLLLVWFSFDRTVQVHDSACHLLRSYACLDILRSGQGFYDSVLELLKLNCFYPPFTYMVGGCLKLVLGNGLWADRVPMLLYYALMCVSLYKLGAKLLEDKAAATLAVAIVCMYPPTFGVSHAYGNLDLPLLSTTLMTLWVISEWLDRPSWTMTSLMTASAAATVMTKQTGGAFVLVPLAAIAVSALIQRKFTLAAQALAGTAVALGLFCMWIMVNFADTSVFISANQTYVGDGAFLSQFAKGLTNYLKLTSHEMTLLWTSVFLVSLTNLAALKRLRLPLISTLGGLVLVSAFCWAHQTRHMVPALPFAALVTAAALVRLWRTRNSWLRLCVVAVAVLGACQYVVLNFSPYPIARQPLLEKMTGCEWTKAHRSADYRSDPWCPEWRDFGLDWVLDVIRSHEGKIGNGGMSAVCVMPDTEYVAPSALEYLAKIRNVMVRVISCKTWTMGGFKFDLDQLKLADWYLFLDSPNVAIREFKFVDAEAANSFSNHCSAIRQSPEFMLVAAKKLPDQSTISLYRKHERTDTVRWPANAAKHKGTVLYSLDRVQRRVWKGKRNEIVLHSDEILTLQGWAIDPDAHGPAARVCLCIDDSLNVPGRYGLSRPDVAQGYRNPKYEKCGFEFAIPCSKLTNAIHTAKLRILADDGCHYYEPECFTLNIRAGWF